jgi:hypothetical protein
LQLHRQEGGSLQDLVGRLLAGGSPPGAAFDALHKVSRLVAEHALLFRIPAEHVAQLVRLRSGMEWVSPDGEGGWLVAREGPHRKRARWGWLESNACRTPLPLHEKNAQ